MRIAGRSFQLMKIPFQPALAALLLLAGGVTGRAQEPFAIDIVPTLDYEEQYTEHTKIVDEETFEQLENTIRISNARLSLSGVDIHSFNASTPYVIEMGDLVLSGVLGEDPAYSPGKTTASIDIIGANWLTNAPEKVGVLVFNWTESELTFTLEIVAIEEAETNTFSPLAWYYWDSEDDGIEEEMALTFRFGNRSLEDHIVYVTGLASYAEVTTLEDYWDLSRVRLTGSIDSRKPVVSIVSPAQLGVVYTPTTVEISGTAADNASGIAKVVVQVNGGAWFNAVGFESWVHQHHAPLKLGRNTVRVMATDEVGLDSLVESRTFLYSRTPPLQVIVSGVGRVTKGMQGTTYRKAGSLVKIGATPALGHLFDGWTGHLTAPDAAVSFTMPMAPATIQANFSPGPYVQTGGRYAGAFLSPPAGWSASGSVMLSVNAAGALSGRIILGGKKYAFKGAFDSTGTFTKILGPKIGPNPLLTLQVDTGHFAGSITGSVEIDGQIVPFSLGQSRWDAKANPAPQQGLYTLVLPPASPAPGGVPVPEGDGFGILKVAASGVASGLILLPDGTRAAVQTYVTDTGGLPLAARVAGKAAAVSGNLTFADLAGVTDFHGALDWLKDAAEREPYYPEGFLTTLPVAGARYLKPISPPAIFPGGNVAPVVTLGAGLLDTTTIVKTLSLNSRGVATVTDPGTDKLQIKFNFKSGTFSGSFRDPSGITRKFAGAVLQKQNLASGYYLGAGESGYIRIDAAP